MAKLQSAMLRLHALLEPPVGYTNDTKIFSPLTDDPNADLKQRLIARAMNALRLGRSGISANVPLVENELFLELEQLSDGDAEKRDYYELINATQAVLFAINEAAA